MSQISGSKNAKVIKKTTADWAGGFVIPLGLIGYDTDTDELKVGDGVNDWASLPDLAGGGTNHLTLSNIGTLTHDQLEDAIGLNTDHRGLTNNPHSTTATNVGLGNVTNESKATMFTNPTFTGTLKIDITSAATGHILTATDADGAATWQPSPAGAANLVDGSGTGAMQSENITGAADGDASGTTSISIGSGSVASGPYTTVVGYGASAGSERGVAIGMGATQHTGLYGVAIGGQSNATGAGVAIGKSSIAGSQGTALGYGANCNGGGVAVGTSASGGDGIAMGYAALAGEESALALGRICQAGTRSVAIGREATTGRYYNNLAIGYHSSTADYIQSVAIGYNVVCDSHYQIKIGNATETVDIAGDLEVGGDTEIEGDTTLNGYVTVQNDNSLHSVLIEQGAAAGSANEPAVAYKDDLANYWTTGIKLTNFMISSGSGGYLGGTGKNALLCKHVSTGTAHGQAHGATTTNTYGTGFFNAEVSNIQTDIRGFHALNSGTPADGHHAYLVTRNWHTTSFSVGFNGDIYTEGDLEVDGDTTLAADLTVDGQIALKSGPTEGIKIGTTAPAYGWNDLVADMTASKLGVSAPTWATFRGGIKQYKFKVGDEASISFHLPHDYAEGTDIYIHAHWSHDQTDVTTGSVTWAFEMAHAKGHNQAAFSAPVIPAATLAASTTQFQHMISEVQCSAASPSATQLDTNDLETDGLILVNVELTANTMDGGAEPFLHFVDIHYQSTGIPTKNKAPNFYT